MIIGIVLIAVGLASGSPISSSAFRQLQDRIASIEQEVQILDNDFSQRLTDMKNHLEDEGECQGFIDNGKCFTVVIIGVGGLNYYDAKRVCSYDGSATLGSIYTQYQFNKLRDHVVGRRAETSLTFVNVWTAMKRQIPSGRILLPNGQSPSYNGYGNWRNSGEWRTDTSRRTNIYVSFWTDGQSHSSNPGGYGNVWPTFGWNAALCERAMR